MVLKFINFTNTESKGQVSSTLIMPAVAQVTVPDQTSLDEGSFLVEDSKE